MLSELEVMASSSDYLASKSGVLLHKNYDLPLSVETNITETIPRELLSAPGSMVIVSHEWFHEGSAFLLLNTTVGGSETFGNGFSTQSNLALQIKDVICNRAGSLVWTREASRFNSRFATQRIPGTSSQMFNGITFPVSGDVTYQLNVQPSGTMRLMTLRIVVPETL